MLEGLFTKAGNELTGDQQLIKDAIEAALEAQKYFNKRLQSGMLLPEALKGLAVPEFNAVAQAETSADWSYWAPLYHL